MMRGIIIYAKTNKGTKLNTECKVTINRNQCALKVPIPLAADIGFKPNDNFLLCRPTKGTMGDSILLIEPIDEQEKRISHKIRKLDINSLGFTSGNLKDIVGRSALFQIEKYKSHTNETIKGYKLTRIKNEIH
jgi:hypothetical protein